MNDEGNAVDDTINDGCGCGTRTRAGRTQGFNHTLSRKRLDDQDVVCAEECEMGFWTRRKEDADQM